jgi:hypothetical protein
MTPRERIEPWDTVCGKRAENAGEAQNVKTVDSETVARKCLLRQNRRLSHDSEQRGRIVGPSVA